MVKLNVCFFAYYLANTKLLLDISKAKSHVLVCLLLGFLTTKSSWTKSRDKYGSYTIFNLSAT
jgi:hypothetical protein